MKKIALLLTLLMCLLVTSCADKCIEHVYDENQICTICGYDNGNKDVTDVVPEEKLFTVTFDANGGTAIASLDVKDGSKITEPTAPEREGYRFDGWYVGDEKWSFIGYVVTEDLTLTAKWTPITYSVSFVGQDGEFIATQSIAFGGKITKPLDPEKQGYTFDGWYVGDDIFSFDDYVVTDDLTLTAKWTPVIYSVSFVGQDGEIIETQSIAFGGKITKPLGPEKQGHTFDGWYVGDDIFSFDDYVVTDDLTLTAKWTPITYSVSFVDQDGEIIALQKIQYGSTVAPVDPTPNENATFLGWFRNGLVFDFEETVITKDIILEARWIAYVVYFLDGGSNSEKNPTEIYSNGEYPLTLDDPTKNGYIFLGWYTDAELTNKITNITDCINHTLYAAWKEPVYETDYPWNTTNLIFQMTENSNQQELPSTCARYLVGDIAGVSDVSTIDQWVSDRNNAALKKANVTVEYQYLPDTTNFGWGMNIDRIDSEVRSKKPGRPDMYCNFVYDMVAISLRGCFANLLSTTMPGTTAESAGKNYFAFANDPTLTDTGEGYMMDYMRSLTLSKFKMYCISSDYLIDNVRAELVVPVNIALLETLQASGTYSDGKGDFLADRVATYDSEGELETNYTIEDFYQLVYDREWNYSTLAQFSSAIFKEGYEGDESADLRDTVGFALPTGSGTAATGLLYSTPITIIDRTYDVNKGDYTYSYPYMVQQEIGGEVYFEKNPEGTHEELVDFSNNLSALFRSKGVIAVSYADTYGYSYTDFGAIRSRFASDNILFGGIVTLGYLEYNEYREMMHTYGTRGYGIAPIPLYRTNYVDAATGETKVDNYRTVIQSIGKICAVSYTTEKFAQCSAYLNYQSTHSTHILNEYYACKHQSKLTRSDTQGNVEMLKYIRSNVHSSFDQVFEDALGKYYSATDTESINQQWHTMIKNSSYGKDGTLYMDRYYDDLTPVKAWRLYHLENVIYPVLPD